MNACNRGFHKHCPGCTCDCHTPKCPVVEGGVVCGKPSNPIGILVGCAGHNLQTMMLIGEMAKRGLP